MSCTCPGRLEVSGGIAEAKHVTSDRRESSAVCLTNTNSCQLNSTHMTPTNCSRITSPCTGCWINPTACSGQDQDPSNETIVDGLANKPHWH